MESSGKPAADLARELGVRRNQLYKWREQLDNRGRQAFREPEKRPESEEEVARLKAGTGKVKEERDILKRRQRTLPKSSGEVRIMRAHEDQFKVSDNERCA